MPHEIGASVDEVTEPTVGTEGSDATGPGAVVHGPEALSMSTREAPLQRAED